MAQRIFVRNVSAREYLDLFLVSAASSILLLRFALHVLDYPSLGGTKYHIGHMLWGGLAMLLAQVLSFAYMGRRVQRLVAVIVGIGFGVFIDEVGKFVTRDNNYFFRPAVGIIYAIFVALYLIISYLTREQKLTHEEYQLNALRELEEAVHMDMDIHDRAATRRLLAQARPSDPVTQKLHELLYELPVVPRGKPSRLRRSRNRLAQWYEGLWQARSTRALVRWFFVVETLFFLGAVLLAVYSNIDDVRDFLAGKADYGHSLIMGQLASTVVAALCVMIGLSWLTGSRVRALEWFRRATLVNLLLTEFFLFGRIGLGAVPSFVFNLVLFMLLDSVATYERRSTVEAV
jgi:ABC-type multidrug transport system fused ATPase/permease subunit